MAQVHLPAEHSEADLALAGAVAELLASAELYVAWSHSGGTGRPVVPASIREAMRAPRATAPRRRPSRLLAGLRRRLPRRG